MSSSNNTCWFTNMDVAKRHEELILYKTYNRKEFPKYDNYDVIEVSKTADIPVDYSGVMGVPITFLDKYNPKQFEILGIANSARWIKAYAGAILLYAGSLRPIGRRVACESSVGNTDPVVAN